MADQPLPVQNLHVTEPTDLGLTTEKAKPAITMARNHGYVTVDKTLASASNLAKLLPTGTVLAFQALSPSFSNTGSCQQPSNKYLTAILIGTCSLICFFSSFTDSFVGNDGKLYLGIATFNGLYVFNHDHDAQVQVIIHRINMSKFRIRCIDFVHALLSLLVFLIFALTDSDVRNCFFPESGPNHNGLMLNLPLGVGMLSSFVFMIFPTTRRGIGYSDTVPHQTP